MSIGGGRHGFPPVADGHCSVMTPEGRGWLANKALMRVFEFVQDQEQEFREAGGVELTSRHGPRVVYFKSRMPSERMFSDL